MPWRYNTKLNYTKFAVNNSTAIHILWHEGKSSIFLENGKKRQKKGKNAQKHTKIRDIFYHF